jgi:hypothetical protein
MAITTFTASEVTPFKSNHAGLNVVRSTFQNFPTGGITLTVSSIVYMAKIPAGALLVDGYLVGGEASGGEGTWNLGIRNGDGSTTFPVNPISGLSVSDNSLLAAVTLSDGTLHRFRTDTRGALPYKCSISENATYQYHWLVATAVLGSGSATTSLQVVAMYLATESS